MARKPPPHVQLPDTQTTKAFGAFKEAVKELQTDLPKWKEVEVEFSGAGVDTEVAHGLGHKASRYFVVRKTAACDVYDGEDPNDSYVGNSIWLRSTAAATVTLLVW